MVNIKTIGDTNWADNTPATWPTLPDTRDFAEAAAGGNRGDAASGSFNAVAFDEIDVDTSLIPVTAVIPETLAAGDEFFFNDLRGTWANNFFTVEGNGNLIDDGSGDMLDRLICDQPGRFSLVYDGTALRVRSVVVDHRKAGWSIEGFIAGRLVERFDFTDSDTMTLSGDLVDEIRGTMTGLEAVASGALRPTFVEGKGVLFTGAHELRTVGVGPVDTGADVGSIVIRGTQLALDTSVRNIVSLGTSSNSRLMRIQGSGHQPECLAGGVTARDTTAHTSGPFVLQLKVTATGVECVLNGKFLAASVVTPNTGTAEIVFGASFIPDRFMLGYLQEALFINGETSREEDARMAAELLGEDWEALHEDWRYLGQRTVSFEENIAAINAEIAAAPSSTPDQEDDMSSPPTVTSYAGSPLVADFPIGADITNERNMLAIRKGWPLKAGNFVSSPMGLLGYADVDNPTVLYDQHTSFRVSIMATTETIAAHVFAVAGTRVRFIVRPVADEVGKYVDVDGHVVAGATNGSKTVALDFGVSAKREITIELPAGNSFGGFYCEDGGLLEPVDQVPHIRISWISDSFGAGSGPDVRWWAFNLLTADRLGLPRGQFAGNVGGGWESTSGGTVFAFPDRINDITDADLTLRRSIDITELTRARGVEIALGVNDISTSRTAAEWQAIIQPMVQTVRWHLPWAPIHLTGPWDRYYPEDPVSANWRAVDDGIKAAAYAVENTDYISMERVPYEKVRDIDIDEPNNIHPTNVGNQQIADWLGPRIKYSFIGFGVWLPDGMKLEMTDDTAYAAFVEGSIADNGDEVGSYIDSENHGTRNDDAVFQDQTLTAADDFVLDGSEVVAGVAVFGGNRDPFIYSLADQSANNFTFSGTKDGAPRADAVMIGGPQTSNPAGANYRRKYLGEEFDTITNVHVSGATGGDVSSGIKETESDFMGFYVTGHNPFLQVLSEGRIAGKRHYWSTGGKHQDGTLIALVARFDSPVDVGNNYYATSTDNGRTYSAFAQVIYSSGFGASIPPFVQYTPLLPIPGSSTDMLTFVHKSGKVYAARTADKAAHFTGTEVVNAPGIPFADIETISLSANYFGLDSGLGDVSAQFAVDDVFGVAHASENNNAYTVASVTHGVDPVDSVTRTMVTPNEPIASAVVAGNVRPVTVSEHGLAMFDATDWIMIGRVNGVVSSLHSWVTTDGGSSWSNHGRLGLPKAGGWVSPFLVPFEYDGEDWLGMFIYARSSDSEPPPTADALIFYAERLADFMADPSVMGSRDPFIVGVPSGAPDHNRSGYPAVMIDPETLRGTVIWHDETSAHTAKLLRQNVNVRSYVEELVAGE